MGGNALSVITERKTTEQFNKIASEIIPKIKNFLDTDVNIVKCYHEKETHGDMDILIKITHDVYNKNINLNSMIKELFEPTEIHTNGSIISFDYDSFQIDIIPQKESNWDISNAFFSYSPFGNLVGKTAHKFGLKFGWQGLIFPFRNFNGRLSHDITLSKNIEKILEFLGYDYERFLLGFNTEQEIFDYIINGKYFNGEILKFENLNHIDRKRNIKRPDYNRFLNYINNKKINNYNFNKDKSSYIDLIYETFPEVDLKGEIESLRIKDEQNRELNQKFNGKLIMGIYPDLKGKELGHYISEFHKSFDDYREFGLNHTSDEIMEAFKEFYEKEKGS